MEQFEKEQMEREAEEMTAVRYLTKDNAVFERTQGGFVSLTFEGKTWDRVQVIRLFPFTEPNGGREIQGNRCDKRFERRFQRNKKIVIGAIKFTLFYTDHSKSSLYQR